MIARTTEALQPATLERNSAELPVLQQQLCEAASRVLVALKSIAAVKDEVFKADL